MLLRFFGIAAVIAVSALPVALSAQTAITWTGLGLQADAGGASETWTIRLTLNADGSLAIDYPSLGCGGTLTRLRSNGDVTEYRETLTYGANKCVNNGTVGMLPRGAALIWYWTGENTAEPGDIATAVLRRTAAN
jgi:hypothetical protein